MVHSLDATTLPSERMHCEVLVRVAVAEQVEDHVPLVIVPPAAKVQAE